MNHNILRKELEKKHSLLWIYSEWIKKVPIVLFIILVVYSFPKAITYVFENIGINKLTFCLFIPLLLTILGCTIKLFVLPFMIVVIIKPILYTVMTVLFTPVQLYNMRYIPISHTECIELNITTIEQYIIKLNTLMMPIKYSTILFFPRKLTNCINATTVAIYGQPIVKTIHGFRMKESERDE